MATNEINRQHHDGHVVTIMLKGTKLTRDWFNLPLCFFMSLRVKVFPKL